MIEWEGGHEAARRPGYKCGTLVAFVRSSSMSVKEGAWRDFSLSPPTLTSYSKDFTASNWKAKNTTCLT